jgi:hypothetical protein
VLPGAILPRLASFKSLILLARPRGFEPLTFAFGGQATEFARVLAADQEITDSYTNVSAVREQLREAAETVAAFIVRRAGCNPDSELTRRLQNQATADRG